MYRNVPITYTLVGVPYHYNYTLVLVDKECFETITDECAYRALQDASLPDDEFEELTESLVKIVNAHS